MNRISTIAIITTMAPNRGVYITDKVSVTLEPINDPSVIPILKAAIFKAEARVISLGTYF